MLRRECDVLTPLPCPPLVSQFMFAITQRVVPQLIFIAALLIVPLASASSVEAQRGPSSIVVAPVIERRVAPEQPFVANINPHRRSVIGSAVDGRLVDFLVDAGQAVEEDQEIARIRTRTIEIELAGAKSELELRKAELRELQNGSRPDEIALAEAAATATQATSDYAQAKLARAESLYQNASGLSRDEFELARAEALAAKANLTEKQSTLNLVREGPRQEQKDQAAARVAIQEQIVAGIEDRLEKCTIRAPYAGFIAAELTEAGSWISEGDPIVDVIEIDPVEVEVFVPEANIGFVRAGDQVQLTIEALGGATYTGMIANIVPLADPRSRTFPVRILVENPPVDGRHTLLPGMLARVSLPTEIAQTTLMVPKDALQLGGPSPVVYRVVDAKATLVPVRTGPSLGSWIAVQPLAAGALSTDDFVVTRGNERLRPNQDVQVASRESPPDFAE